MNSYLWLDNLLAWSMQTAALAAAGILLPGLLRLRDPRAAHTLLRGVLALCLLLPALQPWREQPGSAAAEIAFIATLPGAGSPARDLALPGAGAILLLLGAVTAVRLLWLLAGLLRLWFYRRQARPLASVPPGVLQLQARLGVRPRFYSHGELRSPVTFGFFRPAILLPESFASMDPKLQEAVACHELWHVRRCDWLWTLAEELVRAVFWFHPLLLWLIDRIRLTREQVVDSLAVRAIDSRKHYVQALLEIAATPWRPSLVAPSFLRKHHLTERLALLIKEAPMSRTRLVTSLFTVSAAVVLAGGLAVRSFPLEAAPQKQKQEHIYRVSSDPSVTAPKLLSKVEPECTQEARDAKVQGTVVLEIHVTPAGRTENIKVKQSLDPGLDANAIAALRKWKFKPATKDGKPVTVAATVEVNYRLD